MRAPCERHLFLSPYSGRKEVAVMVGNAEIEIEIYDSSTTVLPGAEERVAEERPGWKSPKI